MTRFLNYSIGLLVLCLAASTRTKAQNKIVIDDTGSQKKITKFNGHDKEITVNDLKTTETIIQIDADYKPAKLFKIENGNPKPQPNGLKKDTTAPAGFVSFILAAVTNYNEEEQEMSLLMSNNKTFKFKIVTKKGNSGGPKPEKEEQTASPIPDCVKEKLKKLNFTFIDNALMTSLSGDPCGGTVCKNCEPSTGVIIYDFKTNKTSRTPKHPLVGSDVEFIVRNVNPYLYNVTISDTTLNYNQDTDGTYLSLLLGPGFDAAGAQSTDGNKECPVSEAHKLIKAVVDLYEQLNKFYDELMHTSHYTDASCFGEKIRVVQKAIDAELSKNFKSSLKITDYRSLIGYMKENSDVFEAELVKKLDTAYYKLESKHFVYTDKINEVDNVDEVQFRLNIVPKNKDLGLPFLNKGISRAYTKGGFKIDVSSGLYYGFFNNHNYSLRADSVQQAGSSFKKGKRIFSEETGKGEFGFASFLHFYPRIGGWVNVSATIGAGVNLNDKPKPRYFGGVSTLIGRGNSRIGINVGIVMGNATRISSQYAKDASGNLLMLPEDEKDVATIQKFNSSFFVSVSYNLPFALKGGKKPQTSEAPVVPAKKEAPNKDKKEPAAEEPAAQSQSTAMQPMPQSQSTAAQPAAKNNPTVSKYKSTVKSKTRRRKNQ